MWYLILLFIVITLPDIYIWQTFMRRKKKIYSILFWVPLALTFISFLLGINGVFPYYTLRVFFVLFLCVAIPKLFFAILYILGKYLGKVVPRAKWIRNGIAFGFAILVLCCALYGFMSGWKKLIVVEHTIESSDVPAAFNDYRIVQLSDLHVGTFKHDADVLDSIVSKVNALQPDVILFTGDLINVSPDELDPYMDILSQLKAKDGIYSILGNHDYMYYDKKASPEEITARIEDLKKRQKAMGWDLLLNEHRIIERDGQKIAIIGVENESKPPHPALADLPAALRGIPEDAYKILLTHDPQHWKQEVIPNTNIPLTLSGHTHAMQVKIGKVSPSQLIYDDWGGMIDVEDQLMYVNAGTGSSVPFRFGAWPEIGLFTLKNK